MALYVPSLIRVRTASSPDTREQMLLAVLEDLMRWLYVPEVLNTPKRPVDSQNLLEVWSLDEIVSLMRLFSFLMNFV